MERLPSCQAGVGVTTICTSPPRGGLVQGGAIDLVEFHLAVAFPQIGGDQHGPLPTGGG